MRCRDTDTESLKVKTRIRISSLDGPQKMHIPVHEVFSLSTRLNIELNKVNFEPNVPDQPYIRWTRMGKAPPKQDRTNPRMFAFEARLGNDVFQTGEPPTVPVTMSLSLYLGVEIVPKVWSPLACCGSARRGSPKSVTVA